MRAKINKTLRDGSIQQVRTVHHNDGTVSIKRTIIQKSSPAQPVPRIVPKPNPVVVEEETPKTLSALKALRSKKNEVIPASPLTNSNRGKRTKIYEGKIPHSVVRTNNVQDIFKRIKAHYGAHIDQFLDDFETAHGNIRSPNLEGGSGGSGGIALPLAAIMAQDRLKEFERFDEHAFNILKLVCVFEKTPQDLHKIIGVQTVVASQYIRDSSWAAMNFYTPTKTRPNKQLVRIAKWVEEQEKKFKA